MTATIATATTTTPPPARPAAPCGSPASPAAPSPPPPTAIAGFADAIDHPLTVDGEMIPVLGFAQMTLIGAVLGVVAALVIRRRAGRPRRTFVSPPGCSPPPLVHPSVAMGAGRRRRQRRPRLVATHLIAAAIVVPALLAGGALCAFVWTRAAPLDRLRRAARCARRQLVRYGATWSAGAVPGSLTSI